MRLFSGESLEVTLARLQGEYEELRRLTDNSKSIAGDWIRTLQRLSGEIEATKVKLKKRNSNGQKAREHAVRAKLR